MSNPTMGSGVVFQDETPEVAEPHVKQWDLPADEHVKNDLIDEILGLLGEGIGTTQSERFRYRLVIDEALTNAVTHGCPKGVETIRVDLFQASTSFALRVKDQGPGFRRELLVDPTAPGNELREHGRGVFIMERYSKRVVFSSGGRELTLWMELYQ
ncbi:MAG: ATP-binding protein [Planctomycetota bacterium]